MKDNEAKKTLTFVLVAGMALLVAWEPWRPAPLDTSAPAEVGNKLFPDFTDPLAAKSLEIVQFNEENASIRDFKVAQTNGVWSIPSHSNYPADAQQHMADAATLLMDLQILGQASDRPGDQTEYGVITPDPVKLKVGMVGVGTRVTVKNEKDKTLADLVIGKPVKDQPALHYVRRADRDQIYTVRIATDKLSTKFGDWIEKDLLKLNAFDVRDVELNDYSTLTGIGPDGRPALQLDERSKVELSYDDAKSQWNLVEMTEFDPKGEPTTVTLTDDEQLNNEKLNDLKNALDELQIVNVERKPAGLSRDLRASEDFLNNQDARSLQERGFIVAAKRGQDPQIFSSEGEVTCTTKDGVRYVLRFGNLAGTSSMPDEAAGDSEEPKSAAPNRFLFVMAEFDESQIPKPELEPVPGETPDEKPAADDGAEPASDAESPADKPAEKPAEKPAAESVPETKTADLQDQGAGEVEAAEKAAEGKDSEAGKAESGDAESEAPAADEAQEPAETKPATPEEEAKLAIQRENKRRQDEYDNAIKQGQEKVKELNDRFADWYYVISDDVYHKIHLGRGDIITKKASDDASELDKLEENIKLGPGAQDGPQ